MAVPGPGPSVQRPQPPTMAGATRSTNLNTGWEMTRSILWGIPIALTLATSLHAQTELSDLKGKFGKQNWLSETLPPACLIAVS